MIILVINSGSSSIKYSLFEMDGRRELASGLVEQIGESNSTLKHEYCDSHGNPQKIKRQCTAATHREGLQLIREVMRESALLTEMSDLRGVGHRVVHGGEDLSEPRLIDQAVVDNIREYIPLAPLHNPANLVGIEVTLEMLPHIPQVAVFDTAFHQTLPAKAFNYALPYELYTRHKVRRYGFHGTSHLFVARSAANMLDNALAEVNLITLHLGNGASACAIAGGRSIDTSMGMTPLEGLIMGTRCGDIDPGILFHLSNETGYTSTELDAVLNKESGLKGICGTNDMREVLESAEQGNAQAQLALEMVCYRIKKYIGAYFAVLGRVDAVVFTGGIGENAAPIRAGACEGLASLGIEIDPLRNTQEFDGEQEIQSSQSPVKVFVIPTNEELEIAQATAQIIQQTAP